MRRTIIIAIIFIGAALSGIAWILGGPPQRESEPGIFSLREDAEITAAADSLENQRFIRNAQAFRLLFRMFAPQVKVAAGGYRLNRNMNAWQVMKKVSGKPDLFWVMLSGCLRKEQVGEVLASALGWSPEDKEKWNEIYKEFKPEYVEGVYFPDTYLLPVDEPVGAIAQRFYDHFNEKFATFADSALGKNIKWTTVLKIASLIEREAAGEKDMKLISGIIWNRLERGMKLEIDATLQYTRGKQDGDWWGGIDLAEKLKDSPYNTYMYKGLPPSPICSPSLAAVEAALNPEETRCYYYLHDPNRLIHCAETYEGHKENIRKFL